MASQISCSTDCLSYFLIFSSLLSFHFFFLSWFLFLFFFAGGRAWTQSLNYHKLFSQVSWIWGNLGSIHLEHKGQSWPGKTTFVIMALTLPAKYFSLFSTAVTKHHEQGHSYKKGFNSAYSFRGWGSMMAEQRHGGGSRGSPCVFLTGAHHGK